MSAATEFTPTGRASARCDVTAHRTSPRPDAECRIRATEFLTAVIGAPPDELQWDDVHHLRGHVHHDGHELVVIAGRDASHEPVVLTVEDWNRVRRDCCDRRVLLSERAIADRRHLEAAFSR
jgi:hypothetical protein